MSGRGYSREKRSNKLPLQLEAGLTIAKEKLESAKKLDAVKVLVSAIPEVIEDFHYDNWDGGQYSHRLILQVSLPLYSEVLDSKEEIATDICALLNKVKTLDDEFWHDVMITFVEGDEHVGWRERSKEFLGRHGAVASKKVEETWGEGEEFKVFLSHKVANKAFVKEVGEELRKHGIRPFVAHKDIGEDRKWLPTIRLALWTMDALVAFFTTDFNSGEWTMQEIGAAVGRDVPVIGLSAGIAPLGFASERQGLVATNGENWLSANEIAKKIVKALQDRVGFESKISDHHQGLVRGLIAVLRSANTYFAAEKAVGALRDYLLEHDLLLSDRDIESIQAMWDHNDQFRDGWNARATVNQLMERNHASIRFENGKLQNPLARDVGPKDDELPF